MHSPILQFPPPPVGKSGWPWMVTPKELPPHTPSGKPWPKISIVTPSYNQGQFLEETIRSVLLQDYPNLEYIIMDGGSTDNSVEIIKKYEPWLTSWVSEKDNGQADAIHRGFEKATGEIIGWINSDDYYLPGAFEKIAKLFQRQPHTEMIAGACQYIRAQGRVITKNYGLEQDFDSLLHVGMFASQPAMFWRRDIYHKVGGLDPSLAFCMDYDLALKFYRRQTAHLCHQVLAVYRFHENTKSTNMQNILADEDALLGTRYGRSINTDRIGSMKKSLWKKYHRRQLGCLLANFFTDPLFAGRYFIARAIEILRAPLRRTP